MGTEQQKPVPATDGLETAVDESISKCDGDLRSTIRALIVANDFLHSEVERLRVLTSHGFARGKLTLLDLP